MCSYFVRFIIYIYGICTVGCDEGLSASLSRIIIIEIEIC